MSLSDAPTTASLAERLPWLDRAATMLLTTSNPAIDERLAACALLAGASGRRAIEALVAALDDNAATVRMQAVTSLASSSVGDHALRFAHAALHRRTDVRRAALHAPLLSPALLGALLGDSLLREEAAAVLVRRAGQQPAALAALVVMRRQGLVDDGHVAEALLALPWSACAPFLRALPAPTAAPGSVPLTARLATMGDDHFVDVVSIVANNSTLVERFATGVADAARRHLLDVADLERIALSITVVAGMRGTIDPALIAIAAVGDLDVAASEMIAPATRRSACALLLRLGSPRHDDVFARLKATAPWAVDDDLDLAVLAGLQRVCRQQPVAQLTAVVTPHVLAAAFVITPTPALLSLPPTDNRDRIAAANCTAAIAQALCTRGANEAVDMSVLSELAAVAADPLPILDRLRSEPDGHARLLLAILTHDDVAAAADDNQRPEEIVVSERRLERVIEVVIRTLDVTALASVVRRAADALKGGASRARVVVAAITRVCPLPMVAAIVDDLDASCRGAVIDVVCAALPPRALNSGVVAGDENGVIAALQRRAPGVITDLDALELESVRHASAATLGAVSMAMITGRRRRGLCAALQKRTISDDHRVVAALLASHDPPAVVAALVAPLSSLCSASTSSLLSAMPAATLPLLGLCLRDVDADLGPLATEIAETPGGLRGAVSLALHLQAPVDVVVLEALSRFARVKTAKESTQGPFFDDRLRAELEAHLEVEPAGERADVLRTLVAFVCPGPAAPSASPPIVSAEWPWSVLLIEDDAGCAEAVTAIGDEDKGRLISAGLLAGLASPRLLQLLRALPSSLREPFIRCALREHHDAAALDTLVRELPLSSSSAQVQRLREIAHQSARQATTLVGRPIGVTWIGSALGFTRLGSSQIHINPLPVLLDERDGTTIVAGLIAHELGHHRYHGDVDGQRIWAQAQREQLGQVLNLVADEHLERNLRVLSPERYGRPLQVLAAWAFQHRHKEFALTTLLSALGARALTVLSAQRLGVARSAGAVVVDVGGAFTTLETQGSAFSRFMRALRMGKGDRFDDPLVARGLALFAGPGFRTSSMTTLLEIARALRQIFGDELRLLQTFDFHAVTDASDDERIEGGLGADELASANVAARTGHRDRGDTPARSVNLEATTTFAPIGHVERVAFDLRAHQALVASVRRPVEALRRVLLSLGEGTTTRGRQLRGHRVDRASLVDVVTRGDPRLLVARHRRRSADLFIGIAVDCSGSMRGAGLDRARHFAAVIAGAARDLDTVDARFIGFSDETLYDAGDARRCAVAALRAHRGNNDAAALWHLAGLARRSARQIKLLVMISDGAPTECSVEALRALVLQLCRRGMICAQVAVTPLDEVCFPHHVLVNDDDLAAASRRFGAVVERLVANSTNEQRATSSTTTYTDAPPATTAAEEDR